MYLRHCCCSNLKSTFPVCAYKLRIMLAHEFELFYNGKYSKQVNYRNGYRSNIHCIQYEINSFYGLMLWFSVQFSVFLLKEYLESLVWHKNLTRTMWRYQVSQIEQIKAFPNKDLHNLLQDIVFWSKKQCFMKTKSIRENVWSLKPPKVQFYVRLYQNVLT